MTVDKGAEIILRGKDFLLKMSLKNNESKNN